MAKRNNNKPKKEEKVFAVTGCRGRLGSALLDMGYLPIDIDITNPKQVKEILGDINPDVLVNCASITEVDGCELDLFSKALQVNGIGVSLLRDSFNGRMIHISTDYIFDGKNGPYSENSPSNPVSQYGLSKLLGEELLRDFDFPTDTIIRTTVLYGSKIEKGDFVRSVISKLEDGNVVTLPMNLFGTPTYIPHLAEAIHYIARMKTPPKIVNVVGRDVLSRYELGLMIANIFSFNPTLVHPTRKIDGIAQRPKKAGLKVRLADKLGIPIYPVHEGLKDFKKRYDYSKN